MAPAKKRRSALGRRMRGESPFAGDIDPVRVPLFGRGRPAFPVPNPWNYQEPLRILETFFQDGDGDPFNRYFDTPGFPLGLVTRDPEVIKAVLLATGDKEGQFDRDPRPARGIARMTGEDTMLYANGEAWRVQKRLAAPSFSRSTLFCPEKFHEFEQTFRTTVAKRLGVLRALQKEHGESLEVELEAEIQAIMLEMLVNNFFGARVAYEELRERYVPAINGLIQYMVKDTVGHQFIAPFRVFTGKARQIRRWRRDFERITDIVLEGREHGRGAWAQFESDVPDEKLRSNIRVFLAGALEATTSLAAWTISHLARRPDLQEEIFQEIKDVDHYDPENLEQAVHLDHAIEETLRFSPALYFLPRYAPEDIWVDVEDRHLLIPKGTHVVLDVWHANRAEAFWGTTRTGYPADRWEPHRWRWLAEKGVSPRDRLHFGFGHGARVCPGKFLGQLEVGLVVGGFVKMFTFEADHEVRPRAGVSTKPDDGVWIRIKRR